MCLFDFTNGICAILPSPSVSPFLGPQGLFRSLKTFQLFAAFFQFLKPFKGRHGAWWRLPAAVGQPRRLSFPAAEPAASLAPAEARIGALGARICVLRLESALLEPDLVTCHIINTHHLIWMGQCC